MKTTTLRLWQGLAGSTFGSAARGFVRPCAAIASVGFHEPKLDTRNYALAHSEIRMT